ncbi:MULTISPECIES: hypothetical protein [unclassified Streptomyces]|nr:hypothetical protein [Streptomyces sp. PBSH9]
MNSGEETRSGDMSVAVFLFLIAAALLVVASAGSPAVPGGPG